MNYFDQQLLIAMPGMEDPNFDHGVTLMCQHNADGALGISINQTSDLKLIDVLSQLDIECPHERIANQSVLHGGPVQQERGFVLHTDGHWEATSQVAPGILVTTSRDILEAIAENRGPKKYVVALGYAGWSAGQLEDELKQNAWLNAPAESAIIFDAPIDDRWARAIASMGIEASSLQPVGGHA